MRLLIDEWEWDDGNVEHLARRGVTPERIEEEIWALQPKFNANRHNRSASHYMIGPDQGGALWTICIIQIMDDPATWRAITGWRSKPREIAWYWRAR
jgi:hypothetical protein